MSVLNKILPIVIYGNLIFFTNNLLAFENKILFKVNNEIITSIDILNEVKYLKIINQELINAEENQIYELSKKSLIRERVKKIELLKNFGEIKIENEVLNDLIIKYFRGKIGINSITEFEKYFKNLNIHPNTIAEKIAIELMWNQLIFNKYNKQVKIDKELVKKEIKNKKKQKEYFLYEIVFEVNDGENLNKKFSKIKEIIDQKDFNQAATIFSVSDNANIGGELGWINENSINKNINNMIKKINIGEYTSPIVIPGGFLILKLANEREVENKIDLDIEIKKIIDKKTNQQLNQFSIIYYNTVKKNLKINEL